MITYNYRYNISTGEFDGFNSSVNSSIKRVTATVFNAETNTVTLNKQISELDVYSKFGFDFESAKQVCISYISKQGINFQYPLYSVDTYTETTQL